MWLYFLYWLDDSFPEQLYAIFLLFFTSSHCAFFFTFSYYTFFVTLWLLSIGVGNYLASLFRCEDSNVAVKLGPENLVPFRCRKISRDGWWDPG